MRLAVLRGVVALALLGAGRFTASADTGLEPYQLVRSLQLVQDRIAGGDHAALPMQQKLLEIIDARLRAAAGDDLRHPKNFRALLVYGMSGGNPVTVEAAASRVHLDPQDRTLATGVIGYLNGKPAGALEALNDVDPMALPSDLGAYVALVKGSLLSSQTPAAALKLFDEARLLSPGTLVEEAALRRSIAITAAQGDAARFVLASRQYVERFLHSPYASQFADAFASGVIAMHLAISQDKIDEIASMMDAEREKVIYLRIARRAAIDGLNDLAAFASAKAERGRGGNASDPRALLYAGLSAVTSQEVDELRARLEAIDRSQLSQGDRALLDAADAIVKEMAAPPAAIAAKAAPAAGPEPVSTARPALPEAPEPAASDAPQPSPSEQFAVTLPNGPADQQRPAPQAGAAAAMAHGSDLPPVEGAMPESPASDAPQSASADTGREPALAEAGQQAAPGRSAGQPNASAPGAKLDPYDPADATMIEARRKLDLIDHILGAAPQ